MVFSTNIYIQHAVTAPAFAVMDTLQSLGHLSAPHLSLAWLSKDFVLPVPGRRFQITALK